MNWVWSCKLSKYLNNRLVQLALQIWQIQLTTTKHTRDLHSYILHITYQSTKAFHFVGKISHNTVLGSSFISDLELKQWAMTI
jgi:hypothetical protein